ncbi:hypothetical protein [Thermoactinomyces mirandus]|uniref:Uncharacterized protein n=1 Tax=Thermoactinomyces mirandus TaxID=2756294 RepID=A0A7W2ASQ9_9BACL|nr:hypothetical protein [Thermoactinomyces mirandus]MBA4602915.1 hypothetical protein [Thermoactinomyces mirandus]
MGTPANILIPYQEYTPEKFLFNVIVSAYFANLQVRVGNVEYFNDGHFKYMQTNICEKLDGKQFCPKQFLLYVSRKDKYPGESFYYYEDVGLDPSLELCRVGYIEDIKDVKDIVFRFSYEYLKRNPKHYFWVPDFDWVYTWEDMQKLKNSYDPYWCYKDPKTGKFEED